MSAEKPTVHLLPFETDGEDGETEESAAESLFESLTSSPDETTGEASEDDDEDEESAKSQTDDEAEGDESDDGADDGDDDEDGESDDEESGESEDEEDGDNDVDSSGPKIKLKVGGKEMEIPADAVITVRENGADREVTVEEARAGYMRTSDYTRKTQEAAEVKKSSAQAREQYTTRLKALEETIAELHPAEPNWEELRRTRGEGAYAAARADWDVMQRDLSTVRNERVRLEKEAFNERAEAERQKLLAAVPEWSDPEKAQADGNALVEFARNELGLSDDEIKATIDHRIILLMRESMAYRAMKKQGGDKIRSKTAPKTAAKVAKPGAKSTPTQKPAKKASKKSLRKLPRSMTAEQAGMAFLESGLFD